MSKLFRDQAAYLRAENKNYSAEFVRIPLEDKPVPPGCIAVLRSNRFLVQIFEPSNGAQRISICRTMVDTDTGRWVDGIEWEEIQGIKQRIGFGDCMAVEIYPQDWNIVNVANMRHIWLVDALPFAWRRE